MPAINKLVMAHDDIGGADEVGVDLSIFTDFGTASDLLWWWEMEFGTGRSRMGSEIDWLFQQGIERARRGYQRRIAGYSVMAGAVWVGWCGRASICPIQRACPGLASFEPPQGRTEQSVALSLF